MADQKLRDRVEVMFIALAAGILAADLCFIAPSVFESSDYILMWKPIWRFLTHSLQEGAIPLWNPYIGLGRPFVADTQNAVFYPPLYLICAGQQLGVYLLIWLHCLIAVFGMRRLGDELGVGRGKSNFMALCLLGSGALTARWLTGQIPYCWGLCYTPWLFACAARVSEPWSGRRVAGYALLLALQFLCGNPPVFWFSTIGQGVFVLACAARRPARLALRDIGQFGAAFLWCLGLVAAVLLPFLELVGQGNRNAPTRTFASYGKLEWQDFGSLLRPIGLLPHVQPVNWESNLFIGGIVALLGVAGLCRIRERRVRGLLAVLVVSLLIALADNTPAFELFYRALPGYASFRCQSRAAFLAVFALICGAGIWLSRPHSRLKKIWVFQSPPPIHCLFIALIIFQTIYLLCGTQRIRFTYTFEKINGHKPDFPFENLLVEQLGRAGLMEKWQPPPRVSVPEALAPANDAMMRGFSSFNADFSLFLRRDWDYLHRMAGLKASETINTHVSETVYEKGAFPYSDLALSAGFDAGKGALYVASEPSPRAFLVYETEVADYDEILTRLAAGHDIKKSALLEKPLEKALQPAGGWVAAQAKMVRFEPDSILVEVDAKADALLVLAEAWYPGWRAEIEGRTYPCIPANVWMRAVPVPAGKHQVRIYFHQDYLAAGVVISTGSVGWLVVVWFWPKKKDLAAVG